MKPSSKYEQLHPCGRKLAELLNLTKDSEGRYSTNDGNKTEYGLYLTICRYIQEYKLSLPQYLLLSRESKPIGEIIGEFYDIRDARKAEEEHYRPDKKDYGAYIWSVKNNCSVR